MHARRRHCSTVRVDHRFSFSSAQQRIAIRHNNIIIILLRTAHMTYEDTPAAMNIATISAGFEKGDFLVREEQGNRVYFDFFEEVCLRIQ